jgi:cobalt transporter subunit CbtB
MSNSSSAAPTRQTQAASVRSLARAWPVVLAMLLGAFIVYGAGFASPAGLHNAAHDSRHSFAFPCH